WPWLSSLESPAHPVKSLTANCPAPGAHSTSMTEFDPEAVTGRTEILQRSSLLHHRGVLSFRLEAPNRRRNGLGAADCSREPNGARAEAKWTSDNGCVASACSPTSRRFATTASTSMSCPV